jgi:hypothetical protein
MVVVVVPALVVVKVVDGSVVVLRLAARPEPTPLVDGTATELGIGERAA